MIRGIGTDIIEISRIEKAMKKIQFLQKVFTEKEQEEQKARGEKMELYVEE